MSSEWLDSGSNNAAEHSYDESGQGYQDIDLRKKELLKLCATLPKCAMAI